MSTLKNLLAVAVLLASTTAAFAGSPYGCHSGYCPPSYQAPSYGPTSYAPTYTSNYAPTCPTNFHSCNYSNWTYDQGHNYYYCTCSFRTSCNGEWNKYVCIYNQNCGNCCYFYNPVAKSYWGKYDYAASGFSTLQPDAQRGTIAELPADQFTTPAANIAIPGSQVNEQLIPPPGAPAAALAALPQG